MQRGLWKALAIVFISSFCVMVIELIAARILAPYIGVSLYTWTSIIGVIMAGIAIGNFLGGKIADKYPSPSLLAVVFIAGGAATIAILPLVKWIAFAPWFVNLPIILSFVFKAAGVFMLPALILSMVSPFVIKLTLANTETAGGTVGTIYAFSTVGSILGTFVTGFYLILWFGTRSIVWMVAGLLILVGIVSWFVLANPNSRWRISRANLATLALLVVVVAGAAVLYRQSDLWQQLYAKESNYFAINVTTEDTENGTKRALILDHLVHSFVYPEDPKRLDYGYETTFIELTRYLMKEHQEPRILHLGGGGYSFSRYMESVYPSSINEVIEIDPEVTKIAYSELGLPPDIDIKTYNEDARLFLIQDKSQKKYDVVAGDVFNDLSTPYHLTTLEFNELIKSHMTDDGIYMINIIDDLQTGKYIPSFVSTLKKTFKHVYLLAPSEDWRSFGMYTFVIAASDRAIERADYLDYLKQLGIQRPSAYPTLEADLAQYLNEREPILLVDDHVPTDILVAPMIGRR
jgi:spermidine synthase